MCGVGVGVVCSGRFAECNGRYNEFFSRKKEDGAQEESMTKKKAHGKREKLPEIT